MTDNRAVTVGLGGTVITDTAALLLLVVVARLEVGDLDTFYLVTTGPVLIIAAVSILWALRQITTRGDIVVKALPSTSAGLGDRVVRQIHGLDDRVIVTTSPASTDLAVI